jgi:hypothetical protein
MRLLLLLGLGSAWLDAFLAASAPFPLATDSLLHSAPVLSLVSSHVAPHLLAPAHSALAFALLLALAAALLPPRSPA